MKDLSEAMRSLKTQLDQMSTFCEKWTDNMEDIDADKLLDLEKEFLCCKKKVFNAANGVNREIITLSRDCTIKV